MNIKQKILRELIENKNKEYTIRELSLLKKIDYKNTYGAVQNLKNSLKINKKGNCSFVSYSNFLTKEIYEVELIRRDNVIKNIGVLYRDIETIENPFVVIVLFGSFARGEQTKKSDIDICVLHDNEEEVKKIENKLNINPNVDLHVFHYLDFIKMIKTKEFNVGLEILKNGIVLKNIEGFYGVIKYG
jgi:predicted nucleotidyltransferase